MEEVTHTTVHSDIETIQRKIEKESAFVKAVKEEIGKVIVGQHYMVDRLLIALLSNGHVLLEGVPGLAKTMTVRTLAQTIDTRFRRLQFTPDLLPADLIGTLIYDQHAGDFKTKKGPIFSNIVLADEINRSPAKVQSALLEAMQERTVTIGETTFPLDEPFLVLATQNPIEQEGTYPLPEAQLDRFMLKLAVAYPTREEEIQIMERMGSGPVPEAGAVIKPDQIIRAREVLEEIYVDQKVRNYIVDLVFASRNPAEHGLSDLEDLIAYGASPRASINLLKTARARAFLQQRGYVTPEDVRAVAMDVMRHRVLLTYEAEAEEVSAEDVILKILNSVEVP